MEEATAASSHRRRRRRLHKAVVNRLVALARAPSDVSARAVRTARGVNMCGVLLDLSLDQCERDELPGCVSGVCGSFVTFLPPRAARL